MAKKPLMMEEDTAKRQYQTADPELKQILIESFGEEFFKEKITDRVKSFNDAVSILKIDSRMQISGINVDQKINLIVFAYIKAIIIARALNEGWEANFRNNVELKYYISYDALSGTFGVAACSYNVPINTIYFKNNKLARYFIETFPELCNILLK